MGVTNFSLYLPKLMAPTRYVKINCSSYREQFVQLTCTKYSVAVNMGNDMDHIFLTEEYISRREDCRLYHRFSTSTHLSVLSHREAVPMHVIISHYDLSPKMTCAMVRAHT